MTLRSCKGPRNPGQGLREKSLSQDVQEKLDQVRTLVKLGKEQGYLLQDQVNELLAFDDHTPEEIDGVFSTFESEGIEIYEDASEAKASRTILEVTEPVEAAAP